MGSKSHPPGLRSSLFPGLCWLGMKRVDLAVSASARGAYPPSLQPARIGMGIGGLFRLIGLPVATDSQGIARTSFSLPSKGPRERTRQLRQLGHGVLGDERMFLGIGRLLSGSRTRRGASWPSEC